MSAIYRKSAVNLYVWIWKSHSSASFSYRHIFTSTRISSKLIPRWMDKSCNTAILRSDIESEKNFYCRHANISFSQMLYNYSTTSRRSSNYKRSSNDESSNESGIQHPAESRNVIGNGSSKGSSGVCIDGIESSAGHRTSYTRQLISRDDPVVVRLFEGIKAGDRGALAQSITLAESSHHHKKAQAQVLLKRVMDHCNAVWKSSGSTSFRIGLSGPPGAGKSTHIEALGRMLTGRGHKVAVLAVDPSSSTTGGSLLGDKTRMPELSRDPSAYIRPSPAGGNLGGVTRATNDAIVLCEGAGYDVIIVETVGVGQSEFAVSNMVDMFSLLIPPAGGDELQGIKKGIVEVADIVVVNKADGDLVPAARRIQAEYTSAFKFIRPKSKHWTAQVMRVSSVTGEGMEDLWSKMEEFRRKMTGCGEFGARRRKQHVKWMHSQVETRVKELFQEDLVVRRATESLEALVEEGKLTPGHAADILIDLYEKRVVRTDQLPNDAANEEIMLRKYLFEFDKEII